MELILQKIYKKDMEESKMWNIKLLDLNKNKDVKELYDHLSKYEKQLFNCMGCSQCEQNENYGKWCFPKDDDDYINCEFVRKVFKEMYKVDVTDIRFVEITYCEAKLEYTMTLYKVI